MFQGQLVCLFERLLHQPVLGHILRQRVPYAKTVQTVRQAVPHATLCAVCSCIRVLAHEVHTAFLRRLDACEHLLRNYAAAVADYESVSTFIAIICPTHGALSVTPEQHVVFPARS